MSDALTSIGTSNSAAHRTATTRQQLSSVEAEVSAQGLSLEEISRMNHDKTTLAQQLGDISAKIMEATRQYHDQELRVTQSMDRCDRQLDTYDNIGNDIGTLGVIADPLPPGFVRADYSFNLDLGAEHPQDILQDGRTKLASLRSALDGYTQASRDQIDKLCEEATTLEQKHQDLLESVDSKGEDVLRLQIRYDKERKQVDEQKEVGGQGCKSTGSVTDVCRCLSKRQASMARP